MLLYTVAEYYVNRAPSLLGFQPPRKEPSWLLGGSPSSAHHFNPEALGLSRARVRRWRLLFDHSRRLRPVLVCPIHSSGSGLPHSQLWFWSAPFTALVLVCPIHSSGSGLPASAGGVFFLPKGSLRTKELATIIALTEDWIACPISLNAELCSAVKPLAMHTRVKASRLTGSVSGVPPTSGARERRSEARLLGFGAPAAPAGCESLPIS